MFLLGFLYESDCSLQVIIFPLLTCFHLISRKIKVPFFHERFKQKDTTGPAYLTVKASPYMNRQNEKAFKVEGEVERNATVSVTIRDGLNEEVYNAPVSKEGTFALSLDDPPSEVYGRELTAGTYVVWFEDERSIKAKYDLIAKYGIKGTGNWGMAQENPEFWDVFKTWVTPTEQVDGSS